MHFRLAPVAPAPLLNHPHQPPKPGSLPDRSTGISGPYAHLARARKAREIEAPKLDHISEPRACKPRKPRLARAFVVQENEARRTFVANHDIEWCEIAVDVPGAMKPRDFSAQRTEYRAIFLHIDAFLAKQPRQK